ncbi:MAG: TonB-dependent receptor plug domain-containing protein [Candidatus Zixiibacteriota bacterium]
MNSSLLAQNTQDNDSLKVKEKGFDEKVFELFTCGEVITSEDIDHSIVRSFGDIIKRYRAIDVTSYGVYAQPEIASFWGAPSEFPLVFLNHVPLGGQALYFPQAGDLDLNGFSQVNIERIEIFDGPVANIWSEDVGWGGLNLVGKDYQGEEPYSRATYQKGPDHYRHTMLELGRDFLNQGKFYVTGDFRKYGGRLPRSFSESRHLTGKFSFELNPSWEMSFYALHYTADTEIPHFIDALQEAVKKEQSDWTLNLRSWHRMSHNTNLTLDLYYSPLSQKLKGEGTPFPQEKKEKDFSLKGNLESKFLSHNVILKSFLRKRSFDENENPHHSLWDGYVSLADLFQYNDRLAFLLFLKGDKFGDYDPELSAMGGMSYTLHKSLNLFGNLGWHNSNPSLHDLYLDISYHGARSSPLEDRVDYLKDKKILSFNCGAKLREDKFKITLSTNYSRIEGNIIWMEDQPEKRDTDIFGFHQSFKLTPHPNFEAYLSYAYKKSRYQEADIKFVLPFVPQHSMFSFIQYRNERLKGGLGATVRLEGEFLSSRYLGYEEGKKVPEVFLLNSKFDLRFLDLHFYYVIENITDQEYRTRGEFKMNGRTHWWGFYWEFFD